MQICLPLSKIVLIRRKQLSGIMVEVGLIISSIITGLFLLLFALMIYQSLRENRKAYVLTSSLLVGACGGILSLLQYVITSISDQLLFYSIIIWTICYFLIYIFFEQLITTKPNRIRLTLGIILLITSIIFNLLYLYLPTDLGLTGTAAQNYEIFSKGLEWSWDTTYNALGIFIFSFGAYVHFKSYKFTKEIITLIQAISMAIIVTGFFFGYFGGDVANNSDFFNIGDGIKIVGMILFSLIYIIRINFIYRLPVNVYFILIFTTHGLNIHISRVHDESISDKEAEPSYINENLLSSLITAISNLISDFFLTKKNLKAIVAEDRTIVLDTGEYASCAILCDRPTYFLRQSLHELLFAVEEKYQTKLQKSMILKEEFIGIDSIIQEKFPFLVISQKK
jgi:hypothetical protein